MVRFAMLESICHTMFGFDVGGARTHVLPALRGGTCLLEPITGVEEPENLPLPRRKPWALAFSRQNWGLCVHEVICRSTVTSWTSHWNR